MPQEDLGPVGDDGAGAGARETVEPRAQEAPRPGLPPEELLDAGGEGLGQDAAPVALFRAASSTVRSQSL